MASKGPDQKESYVFGRNRAATSRLNYQHFLWQNALGSHLHPSIPQLPTDARIADVATGSGVWLLELAEQLPPSVCLDGLDISLGQCPPKTWLPSNVNFRTWDFFTETPPDLIARYDVVHVRLVAVTIKNNDATVVVKNLAQLLKPGGYLQWDELDTLTAKVVSPAPGLETGGLEQLRSLLTGPMEGRNGEVLLGPRDWIQALPATLTANGFSNAQKHRYHEAPQMTGFWNDVWVLAGEEFADAMQKAGHEEIEKSLRNMALKASSEISAGAAVQYGKMSIVARRENHG